MRVTGGNHGNAQLLTQRHHAAIEITEILLTLNGKSVVVDHKAVVADGLNLQIIVELGDLLDLALGLILQHGRDQLARLAGRADDEPLAVLFQHGFGYARHLAEIVEIAKGNQLIKVL